MAKQKSKKTETNNLIVVSDIHAGCRMAICPPEGVKLQDGGEYKPSKLQIKVWECWEFFWSEWVPNVTKGEPYAVVVNGDALDGIHHGSVSQISHNIADQVELAYQILAPISEICSHFYYVRGTEAHGGKSGENEEMLAKRLDAIPDEEGRCSRWELKLRLGPGLVHLAHHIGTTGSLAYETSALQKELEQMYVEAARWGHEPPDAIVRSHRHRNAETRVRMKKDGRVGFATTCTTAGWQLRTPFAYKIVGGRVCKPQIGGSLVRHGDEEMFTRHCIWDVEETSIEVMK